MERKEENREVILIVSKEDIEKDPALQRLAKEVCVCVCVCMCVCGY